MAISSIDCAPYLSLSLFKIIDGQDPQPSNLLREIRTFATEAADKKGLDKPKFPAPTDPEIVADGSNIAWVHYTEKRPPSWFLGEELNDSRNHLIFVVRRGQLVALLFTDNGLRNTVARRITNATQGVASTIVRLTTSEINKSFVESQVRTLWLSGAHRRTAIKPDSKILSGLELETALDPLGDQSYYFSSVRSTISLSDQLSSKVVGASPVGGRVWIGPTKSLAEFTTNLNLILDRAAARMNDDAKTDKPIPILSSATTNLAGIEQPYDIALITPQQINYGAENNADDERWLQQFADAARFEITPG